MKIILVILGSLFFGLGIVGIILPILPTTPFLLLAAACYGSGNEKCYQWLIEHKYFGSYIQSYRSGAGIPAKTKLCAIGMLWTMISISAYFATDLLLVRVIMFSIASSVTFYLCWLPTNKSQQVPLESQLYDLKPHELKKISSKTTISS